MILPLVAHTVTAPSFVPGSKTLLRCLKRINAQVVGSSTAKAATRGLMLSAAFVFGSFTAMMNLCMSETAAQWVLAMAGHEYTFDLCGRPIGRPPKNESRRIVSANFFACASFFDAYFRAFNHVFMGWDLGAEKQHNPNCLIGLLLAFGWVYEESRRMGCHAHGLCTQAALSVRNLQLMLADPATRDDMCIRIRNHTEAMMASYAPNLQPCG